MDLGNPLNGIFPVAEGNILSEITRTREGLTGRDVARRLGGSHSTVLRGLKRLERQGLVTSERAGSATLYSVNWGHLAIGPILDLVELKQTLFRRIADQVQEWRFPAVKVSVFGSAARSDADADSDIDILVVRPDEIGTDHEEWNRQVSDLGDLVYAWSGNRASIVEVTKATVIGWVEGELPLIAEEIARDEVNIEGPRLGSLLSGKSW